MLFRSAFGSYGFDVIQDNEHHYKWNHVGINYFKPFVFSNYQEVLEKNLFLKQSFENPRLFTGLLLRDLTYTYKSVDDLYGQNQRLASYFEVSCAEVSLANKIFSKDKIAVLDLTPVIQALKLVWNTYITSQNLKK